MKKTNNDRYGVDSVMKSEEIKNKQIASTTKRNFDRYREILGDQVSFINKGKNITVLNQCPLHPEYTTRRVVFYFRCLVNKIENPCIFCNPVNDNSSIKENEIHDFIEKDLNLSCKKFKIKRNEIDVYIPSYKLGIEFDGIYWHSELFKKSDYHLNKTTLCEDNGIQLLHVFEDEWTGRKEIVKSIIKSILGIYNNELNAEDCTIETIDDELLANFLNINNIQDSIKGNINIGLFNINKLVSVMLLNNNHGNYEILRHCNKLNLNIINGDDKLIKYLTSTYNPKSITISVDRRYDNGSKYEKLGFKFIENTIPDYYIYKNSLTRELKDSLGEEELEPEIMLEKDHFKIFDCGQKKLVLLNTLQ